MCVCVCERERDREKDKDTPLLLRFRPRTRLAPRNYNNYVTSAFSRSQVSTNENGAFLEYELELEHSKYASPDNNVSFDPWTREPEIVD